MKSFLTYFDSTNHLERSVIFLIKSLDVKVTTSSIKHALITHPNYPSLLSVVNTLSIFGVNSLAAKASLSTIGDLPTPFLAHIKGEKLGHDLFGIVLQTSSKNIEYFNPDEAKVKTIPVSEFEKLFKGSVLVVESLENAGEVDYKNKFRKESNINTFHTLVFTAIILAFFGSMSVLALSNFEYRYSYVLTQFLTLVGCLLCLPLLSHEIGVNSQALKQFCQTSKKVNCSAVLESKASKVFGISWSVIGSSYFFGLLLFSQVSSYLSDSLFLIACLHVLTFPYVVFSVFYQWKISKQWCVFCLLIQGILTLQLFIALSFLLSYTSNFLQVPVRVYLSLINSFLAAFLIVHFGINLLKRNKNYFKNSLQLQRIKHDTQTFHNLLMKQRYVEVPRDLGILIGSPDAKFRLTKVCNPYCGPCAKAHQTLHDMTRGNCNFELQIIFTANELSDDIRAKPVKQFLDIYWNGNEDATEMALNEWYASDAKDFELWSKNYTSNFDDEPKLIAIRKMREWCDKAKITGTPTYFVDGYELPSLYTVDDLKYLLV
jgi:uncharacterized membrane protein